MANEKDKKKEKNPFMIDVGIRIQKYRDIRNITQEELAEKVDLTTKHLSRLENGYHDPQFTTVVKIAETLDIPLNALLPDMSDDDIRMFLESIKPDVKKLSPEQKKFIQNMIKQLSEIDD